MERGIEAAPGDEGSNEHSPLLSSTPSQHVGTVSDLASPVGSGLTSEDWDVRSKGRDESRSGWYMFLLTISFGGLQMAWSVELSNGSPYLLSLGITKSFLAIVWIAGPLSGMLVQPYVGIKSDRCRSRFGKRRPFMVVGGLATIVSLIILAWARELVGGVLAIFGVPTESRTARTATIVVAVLMIYVLDFSINVVQAAMRAFVVDNAPTHQQDIANAWASRVLGMGNIVGYLFGYADLPKYLWFFGDTQFKVLCVIASLVMAITLTVSCSSVSERDPRMEGQLLEEESGFVSLLTSLWKSVHRLPPQIKNVCLVQVAAWVGWFPFLFYITTFIGELYVDPIFRANPGMSDDNIEEAWERGTRVGTFALLVYALTSFLASVILPSLIHSSPPPYNHLGQIALEASSNFERTPDTPLVPRPSHAFSDEGHSSSQAASRGNQTDRAQDTQSIGTNMWLIWKRNCKTISLRIPRLTLKQAWLLSHVMFSVLMWLTLLVNDTRIAILLVGLVGVPWAMTMWAPFALIATEIRKRDGFRRGVILPEPAMVRERIERREDMCDGADQAGVVLGIHNVAIAAPQAVATLISSAIFTALQKPRGSTGDDSVGWVLRFGGIMALVAAWLTGRITEESHSGEAQLRE